MMNDDLRSAEVLLRGVYLQKKDNNISPVKYAQIGARSDQGETGGAYSSWRNSRTRCLVPSNKDFSEWGGRGIKFCERWLSFDQFLNDMGLRPKGTSLDRIDVNGNYEPGNCRWAAQSIQLRNRRKSISAPQDDKMKRKNIGIHPAMPDNELRKQRSSKSVSSNDSVSLKYAEIGAGSDQGEIGGAYRSWESARTRCLVRSNKDFSKWGGRGIKFCERWLSFHIFLEDMGPRPEGTSLDRIDVNGHYEPGNCRWATRSTQQRNKRTSVNITHEGQTKHVKEWSEELGICLSTVRSRLRKKYSLAAALSLNKYEIQKQTREDYLHFVGLTSGRLTVIDIIEVQKAESKRFDFLCKCKCGVVKSFRMQNVVARKSRSCGCRGSRHLNPKLIQAGQQFGEWTVLEVSSERNQLGHPIVICLCRCACGVERKVPGFNLVAGKSNSCGHEVNVVHGGASKNSRYPKEYQAWTSMKGRCYTPSAAGYASNGAKGIKVCERWAQSFENFLADMGVRPKEALLCRKDNVKDYAPDNCFWGTKNDLPPNSRARLITHNGKTLTLTEWSRKLGIHINTLRKRLDRHNSLFI
jgi:hypothetical protein